MLCIVIDKSWSKLLILTTISFLCNILHGQIFTPPVFFKDDNLFVSIVQVAIMFVGSCFNRSGRGLLAKGVWPVTICRSVIYIYICILNLLSAWSDFVSDQWIA